jgi:arginyl-tRNA synthetase
MFLVFDKMLALQGNTAPYLLYAYVRIQGISRKGGIDFNQVGESAKILLEKDEELVLAKHLLQLESLINTVAEELMPNRLCQYLFELSQKFNQFLRSMSGFKSRRTSTNLPTGTL